MLLVYIVLTAATKWGGLCIALRCAGVVRGGRVVCFDEVNEADVCRKIVVSSCVQECFKGEEAVSASKLGCASELKTCAMFV